MNLSTTRGQFLARASAAAAVATVCPTIGGAATESFNVLNTGANDSLALQQLVLDQRYFEAVGLTVTTQNVSDGVKLLAGIINDDRSVAILTGFGQVFPAIENGANLKIIAGALQPPDVVIFSANPDVRTLKDIEGKSVGTGAPGALIYQETVAMLRTAGVDLAKVTFVNIGSSSDVFRAVTAHKVDAGPGQHDFTLTAKRMGVHVVADAVRIVPEFTQQGSFTTDRAIALHRATIVRVLAAYGKAYRFLHTPQSREPWVAAYGKAVGTDTADEARYKWQWFNSNDGYDAAIVLAPKRIDYMQKLNVELGVQKAVLPLARVADMTLARDALKLV